jgi:hypothetical protein
MSRNNDKNFYLGGYSNQNGTFVVYQETCHTPSRIRKRYLLKKYTIGKTGSVSCRISREAVDIVLDAVSKHHAWTLCNFLLAEHLDKVNNRD